MARIAGVNIPTEDSDAWLWYPDHRWVYDKIAIALSQGLDAGPHGVPPPRFPIFSKPITNLKGMGIASRVLSSQAEYEASLTPGHMWMTLLEGPHVSSDVAVIAGVPQWWRHVTGRPSGEGTFDYWTVHAAHDPEIETYCGAWIRRYLASYTGILNTETIGGRMIEVRVHPEAVGIIVPVGVGFDRDGTDRDAGCGDELHVKDLLPGPAFVSVGNHDASDDRIPKSEFRVSTAL